MTIVALTGTISHVSMGAEIYPLPMVVIVATCIFGAAVSAKFANRCEIHRLNRVVGIVLLILGMFTLLAKFL